ncbi:MAG: WD40 repeat domain-containing protein, partial [Planctomycetales bacterium]|nr:WD40 repeat domain-containing protein [Planctomycetales bacterium]
VHFSSDGDWFTIASAGHRVATYRLVGREQCRTIRLIGHHEVDAIQSLSFSPDGNMLAIAAGGNGLAVHDTETDTTWRDLLKGQRVNSVALLSQPESALVATQTKLLSIDFQRPIPSTSASGPRCFNIETLHSDASDLFARIDKGQSTVLVACRGRGKGAVLDLPDGKLRFGLRDSDAMNNIAISPDGKYSACGSWHNRHWVVWDNETGLEVARNEYEHSQAGVMFSPDGHWLVALLAEEVVFYRVGNWDEKFRMSRGDFGYPNVAFSNDMKLMAISEMYHVNLYDFATQQLVAQLHGPGGLQLSTVNPAAAALEFSRDGRFLAVGTLEDAVLLWDLKQLRSDLRELGLDW